MSEMGTGTATKKCPMCAETIQADALVCRFCGYDYRTPAAPPPIAAYPRAQKTNGLAIASLILGIVWLYGVGALLALLFGYRSKRQIDASNGAEGGRGLAIAGIVLGWVGVAGLIIVVLLAFVFLNGIETSSTFSCTATSIVPNPEFC